MANILYLVHRLPYPPNKGDKLRSYHLLKHLLERHRVFLGTFIDDPEDEPHIELLRGMCADLHVARIDPRLARLRSLNGLVAGEPLTLAYYRDGGLRTWIDECCRTNAIDAAVIFSSAMAQYVEDKPLLPTLIDFVDVDSAKWTQYAAKHRWPLSWLYRREGETLLAYERRMAARATRGLFVTEAEVALFTRLAPECSRQVEAVGNGVDADYFSVDPERPSPYRAGELPVVFTGAMDYWPNIDAVTWFAREMLPELRARQPQARFVIVGRNPAPEVTALADEQVVVTGTVADVRPWLQHAKVVVAPLRVARGIQNKILEAMAMARPVVASSDCAAVIDAESGEGEGQELLDASDAATFVAAIAALLADPERAAAIGQSARRRAVARYSWQANMSRVDRYLCADAPPLP